MFFSRCGNHLEDDSMFCTGCGNDVTYSSDMGTHRTVKTENGKKMRQTAYSFCPLYDVSSGCF